MISATYRKILSIGIVTALAGGGAAAGELVRLDDLALYDLKSRGLELERGGSVRIEAIGMVRPGQERHWFSGWWSDEGDPLSVSGWVLDADTRETVWEMRYRDTDTVRGTHSLVEIDETIDLPAGRYEVYLFSGNAWAKRYFDQPRDERRWWDGWFSDDAPDPDELEEELARCFVALSSDDISRSVAREFEVTGEIPGALVRHTDVGDSQYISTPFRVDRRAEFRVYGMVERSRGSWGAADYAWIVDAETRERVFDSSDLGLPPAGGSRKNRIIDETVTLNPGDYVLHYGTDDSHSFAEFNANPPHDPHNWGVTLLPAGDPDRAAFRLVDAPRAEQPLIEFTRAKDEGYFEQRFRMDKDGKLRILSLGEASDGDFYDYAWIADARGREIVWEMREHNTRSAGGAEKNRMFDGIVELQAGDYVLSYATDGSHSYQKWNSAAPFLPEAWGVTVWAGPGTDRRAVVMKDKADIDSDQGVLASLVRMGDDEREAERFTLSEPTEIFIYAIGEGTDGRMYDYGFIVDRDSGRKVWEMNYDYTRHAGGADKNREIRDELLLPAGTYEVVFVSDGSHSFEAWNSGKPRDFMAWGITVQRADGPRAGR